MYLFEKLTIYPCVMTSIDLPSVRHPYVFKNEEVTECPNLHFFVENFSRFALIGQKLQTFALIADKRCQPHSYPPQTNIFQNIHYGQWSPILV